MIIRIFSILVVEIIKWSIVGAWLVRNGPRLAINWYKDKRINAEIDRCIDDYYIPEIEKALIHGFESLPRHDIVHTPSLTCAYVHPDIQSYYSSDHCHPMPGNMNTVGVCHTSPVRNGVFTTDYIPMNMPKVVEYKQLDNYSAIAYMKDVNGNKFWRYRDMEGTIDTPEYETPDVKFWSDNMMPTPIRKKNG